MKTFENNNWLDDILVKAIGSQKPSTDFEQWQRAHPQAVQTLKSQATRQPHPRRPLDIRRIIMTHPIIKLSVAAAIIIAVITSISIFNKSVPTVIPTAFGIEQVISAYDSVRFLYIKSFWPNKQVQSEFWIESDRQGKIAKLRNYLRETGDGPKMVVWTPEKEEIWFQRSNTLSISGPTKPISPWQAMLDQSQPKFLMEKLLADQNEGRVDVEIQKPQDSQKPALIIATLKNRQFKKIYYIDQATDLITQMENYRVEDNKDFLIHTRQYSNEPIDENFFSLENEVPKDVNIVDSRNPLQDLSLIYGFFRKKKSIEYNEQAAVEIVQQFLEALIDKDYRKAARLGGGTEEQLKNEYPNVTKVISIGEPVLQSKWFFPGYKIPCEVEILNLDGQKTIYKPNVYTGADGTYVSFITWLGSKDSVDGREYITDTLSDPNYEKITPKEAAEAFFKACSEKNWDEFAKFIPPLDNDDRIEQIKEYLGGLQVISIGKPFKMGDFPGWYVPYKVRFNNGLVQEWDLAIRNDNLAKRYMLDGGI
jgi:hypothetical protein